MAARAYDIVLVTGDAHVDHPAFGAALIARHLESQGHSVAVIAQPPWKDASAFARFGRPRLFFGVTAGNLDSMVANYTPDRRRRESDAYSPGGKAGLRPDLASVVYAQRCRQAFPGVPVVMGGIEASLRRLAHYDFVQQKVRGSALADAKADLLVYGMGERAVGAIAGGLAEGRTPEEMRGLAGVAYLASAPPPGALLLPSASEAASGPDGFFAFSRALHRALLLPDPPAMAQAHGKRWVVVNPPAEPLAPEELDALYRLPFTRRCAAGGEVPALEPVRSSVVTHRGCYGGCAFCALFAHQGRQVVSRPAAGVVAEAAALAARPDFAGTITDLGGPTANMYGTFCGRPGAKGRPGCARQSCLAPQVCPHLVASGEPYRRLLALAARAPGVRHLFVASGLRHDLLMLPAQSGLFRDLVARHIGGQMKVAPEHVAPRALRAMNKPGPQAFAGFRARFRELAREAGRELFIVPYLIAGHPGTEMEDALELARFVRGELGGRVEQAQQFTPTPMTPATCMFVTGRDPATGERVAVPSASEAKVQKALLDLTSPRNREKVASHFARIGRMEMVKELLARRPGGGR
jgi:uncharacterized radical SAM protein YgiQ